MQQQKRRRNDNKIKYFEEVCNIEKMLDENKKLKEIYDYMKELVKYTYEDELNYISIPRTMENSFEQGKKEVKQELIPEYIKITISNAYKNIITYRSCFCKIYGILVALYDEDKINSKINKNYHYSRDYINF